MADELSKPCTAFEGHRLVRSGALAEVAVAIKSVVDAGSTESVLVFDDATGRVIDLDLRGSDADVLARLASSVQGSGRPDAHAPNERRKGGPTKPRGRGRPKLGVVAREVTLLPRHWEWLAAQPSGASAALRRLVDEARRTNAPRQKRRAAQEAAYRFMVAIAGDLPDFEEAARALFADDRPGLEQRTAAWPEDVRAHALRLAFPTDGGPESDADSPDRKDTP
ncbi:MAG: DUF2239 family protein [Deinococcales bacterium]